MNDKKDVQPWREWWLFQNEGCRDLVVDRKPTFLHEHVHVLESAPVLARIAELEAENFKLFDKVSVAEGQLETAEKNLEYTEWQKAKLEKLLDEAKTTLQLLYSYRGALLQKEYDDYSPSLTSLLDKTRAFLQRLACLAKLDEGK